MGDVYFDLIRDLTKYGRTVTVRGKECIEFTEPVALIYDRPGYFLMDIPGRKFNPFFMMAEIVWILSGNGNVEWISYFNSKMRDFADEGRKDFHGSYGKRIFEYPVHIADYLSIDQVGMVVNKLKKDPFSRQAVICLWNVEADNLVPSKDIPCNNLVYYALRDGKLQQTVTIRSNDLIWGTPHNAVQFSALQARVAGALGVQMGNFTYVINNLHYYTEEYKKTLAHLISSAFDEEEPLQADLADGFGPISDRSLDRMCEAVEDALESDGKSVILGEEYHFTKTGLWERTIPILVAIFAALKKREDTSEYYQYTIPLLNMAHSLPPIFKNLIIDFYRDSKNSSAAYLAAELLSAKGKQDGPRT